VRTFKNDFEETVVNVIMRVMRILYQYPIEKYLIFEKLVVC